MSIVVLDKPGKAYGIVPAGCPAHTRPQKFRDAVFIGPIKTIALNGTSVTRHYNNPIEQSVTEPKFEWVLANAKSPFVVELRAGTSLLTNKPMLILLIRFSKAADERAFAAVRKAGIV